MHGSLHGAALRAALKIRPLDGTTKDAAKGCRKPSKPVAAGWQFPGKLTEVCAQSCGDTKIAPLAGNRNGWMRTTAAIAGVLAFMGVWSPAGPAAADVALTASNAINVVLEELVPQFERASGHKVTMRLGVASFLRKEIEDGAAFDVAILVGNLDRLVQDGKIAAGTGVALGRSGYGLAVRAGARKPDIATTEAFKRAILDATSVGYTEGGGSGTYFVNLLDKLGIGEAMKPKLRPGTNTQAAVARGEIEMTVTGIVPILRSKGVELAGPLPPDLQSYSTFVAGISSTTKEKEAAAALLRFLTTPEAVAVFKRRGVEPIP
jgi:molybdate transport system substrate-binding protein